MRLVWCLLFLWTLFSVGGTVPLQTPLGEIRTKASPKHTSACEWIVGAKCFTCDKKDSTFKDCDILIQNGRIHQLSFNGRHVESNCTFVTRAAGTYLTPGMVDMHRYGSGLILLTLFVLSN